MAGRPAPRLPHRSVAGVSRTGATLPGGPASGLRDSARYASPLLARVANGDDSHNTAGQAEDKPIVFSCFIWYPKELLIFVPMSIMASSALLYSFYILEQNGLHGPQYWLPYTFTFAFLFCYSVSPTLRIGFDRWQSRQRKRSSKLLVVHNASNKNARSTVGQAEDKPIVLSCFVLYPNELWIFVPMSIMASSALLYSFYILEQNGLYGPRYWLPYTFTFAFLFCYSVSPTLRIGFDRWQSRQRKRPLKRKQQDKRLGGSGRSIQHGLHHLEAREVLGQIGYAICPMIARGAMLGPDQPVILHMLDIEPAKTALEGVRMELIDAAYPLLAGVVATTNVEEACKGVDVAVMVGGFPRKAGMERKDVMSKNVAIYKSQASALEKNAAPGCKVLVVANPANTNSLILKEYAPSIPAENITCMTRLDHNRALGQLSERSGVHVSKVRNVIIWGNHSSTQYPDVNHATIDGKPAREVIGDDSYLDGDFISTVQQRGAAIIKARGLSSALSAASSACDHVRDWVLGTPEGTWVSMGVYSDGSYGAPKDIVYSFPVTCKDGKWTIKQGLSIDDASAAKMKATGDELVEEKALAMECLE
ncbi:malate dehydrogenase [Chlorella vulgaris]